MLRPSTSTQIYPPRYLQAAQPPDGPRHWVCPLAVIAWDTNNVGLTLTEFNVVHLLASRAGEYIDYRTIYDCVHHEGFVAGDGDFGFRTNVRSLIKRIRNKFRAFDADFSEIENFAALGYRWRINPATAG